MIKVYFQDLGFPGKEADIARDRDTIWCDGCGVEITWAPVIDEQFVYCCADCHAGLPCQCGEHMEQEDEYRGHGQNVELPAWSVM